ncbi:MAG: DUF4383 domain-containing protein [Actinomycetota bacterium]
MATRATSARTPAQTVALVFGAVYLLIGILGFFVAEEFTGGGESDKLILFPVNHLHNIVHLAIGAALLGASRAHATAKSANLAVGVVYLLVMVVGFLGALDFLNINSAGSADNFLHLVSGAVLAYFGSAGAEGAGATTTRTTV